MGYGVCVCVCGIIVCVYACGQRLINWKEVTDWLRVGSGAGGVSAALDLASRWVRVRQGIKYLCLSSSPLCQQHRAPFYWSLLLARSRK